MQYTRWGLRWWQAWASLLLFAGLLVLASQLALSPVGHQLVQLTMTLLMFGVMLYWLRRNRGALVNETYEREQAQARSHTAQPPRREPSVDEHEPWDDTALPWHSPGHDPDRQRRP